MFPDQNNRRTWMQWKGMLVWSAGNTWKRYVVYQIAARWLKGFREGEDTTLDNSYPGCAGTGCKANVGRGKALGDAPADWMLE
jgi:hypothetical protein